MNATIILSKALENAPKGKTISQLVEETGYKRSYVCHILHGCPELFRKVREKRPNDSFQWTRGMADRWASCLRGGT